MLCEATIDGRSTQLGIPGGKDKIEILDRTNKNIPNNLTNQFFSFFQY